MTMADKIKKLINELNKIDKAKSIPSPMFWNDEDKTHRYHNKSELKRAKKRG